jgi:hypothetical protein
VELKKSPDSMLAAADDDDVSFFYHDRCAFQIVLRYK